MTFVHLGPKEYWLEHSPSADALPHIIENCRESGATFLATEDKAALAGADVIYTDVWYGLYEMKLQRMFVFQFLENIR